jgi:MFS family permease/predicted enzyme related to lactoylglutathione lyase
MSSSPSATFNGAESLSGRAWGTLLVLCGAIFLDALDVSMIGVALPSIRADLDMSTSSLQWVVSGYVLGYGGFLLLGGRAADLFGRRRMFLVSLAVFAAASGLGAFASDGSVLIATRFIKGVSAAFTAPAGLSIITTSFPEGPARNKALLVYTATAAMGFSLGLVLSGVLTEIGWRWTLFMPVPFSLLTLIAAVPLVPASAAAARSFRAFDVAGALTLTSAMLLLVFTVVEAPASGWASARTVGSFAAVAGILGTFVALELRSATPLVRLGILRSGSLVRANLGAMSLVGSWVGFQFVAVLYMQQLRGWSPIETGLAIFPAGLMVALLSPTLTPRLVMRYGVVPVILAGSISAVAAFGLFLPIGLDSSYVSAMLPTFILGGLAFALAFGPLNIAATNGIPSQEQGLAGGLVQTSYQLGGALVLAVVTAVNNANTGLDGSPQSTLDGFHAALIVPVVAASLGAVATAFGLVRRPARAGRIADGPIPRRVSATPIRGLGGTTIWSEDHDRLVPFYRDVLRLPVRDQTPGLVVLGNGHGTGPSLSIGTHSEVKGRASDPHRYLLGLDSDDLDGDLARLGAAGIAFTEETPPYNGTRIVRFEDPEGNLIQLRANGLPMPEQAKP